MESRLKHLDNAKFLKLLESYIIKRCMKIKIIYNVIVFISTFAGFHLSCLASLCTLGSDMAKLVALVATY